MKLEKCKKHGMVPHIERPDGGLRCGKCASQWVVVSRQKKKEELIVLLGGKCARCGYDKYAGALDFHHRDPKQKSFALSVRGLCYSWQTIVKEVKKCTLLCKNCHAEVEHEKREQI